MMGHTLFPLLDIPDCYARMHKIMTRWDVARVTGLELTSHSMSYIKDAAHPNQHRIGPFLILVTSYPSCLPYC